MIGAGPLYQVLEDAPECDLKRGDVLNVVHQPDHVRCRIVREPQGMIERSILFEHMAENPDHFLPLGDSLPMSLLIGPPRPKARRKAPKPGGPPSLTLIP
jgi:hypothetical protein